MEIRHQIPQHFTASGVVICSGHILLIHHHRIKAWLPPGGHIESFEMPHEAAVREVLEETGVAVDIVGEPVPQTGDPDAFFLEHPLCMHAVRAFEGGADVYHLDLAYLCVPAAIGRRALSLSPANAGELPEVRTGSDVKEARWVGLSDLGGWNLAKNVVEAVDLALSRLRRAQQAIE